MWKFIIEFYFTNILMFYLLEFIIFSKISFIAGCNCLYGWSNVPNSKYERESGSTKIKFPLQYLIN